MKDKIVAITSNFGLGPVGKLSSIINASGDEFEWYALGQEFDTKIFEKNKFKKVLWTEQEEQMKQFIKENNIKYALVILKNKYARLLKSIGVKVIYVDSLPFMWTEEDAKSGKIPYDLDIYCAQKTIELTDKSKELFSKVKNLKWVNPIIPTGKKFVQNSIDNNIIINVGGLHSPIGNGEEYINVVIKPLIECLKYKYKDKNIILTCGNKAKKSLEKALKEYNIGVETFKQEEFINKVGKCFLFFTSPGLTTLLEIANLDKKVIVLPPQNLSQFYNLEYSKKILREYKIIDWNREGLSLNDFKDINLLESEIVILIYNTIKKLQTREEIINEKNYIMNILNANFINNKNYIKQKQDGANEVVECIREVVKGGKNDNK